ncbi:MAG: ribbon-helix-helix protein, CopG family [Gammaproteobacteria bacterium]|jgi:hypothetical protein|nr:MAG: ribbon-helix-helix protein, CopG family [Gammaproteobacteria bacterium]
MKNITLSVDEETYRRVRIAAAERNTTVSALVRDYLRTFARPAEADVGGDPLPPGGGVRGPGLGGAVR